MPRFAANLSMLYNEHAFLDRFAAAARDGFEAVEYLFPYAHPAADLAARLRDHGLQQVLFNAPPGDWDAGERGMACLPGREAEFRGSIERALEYAAALGCPRIHVMAGLAPAGAERTRLQAIYESNLAWAAERARAAGRDVLIEPINTRDIPGFFLNRQDEAHAIVERIGAPNLKVQMDLYHCQIVEGDVATKLRRYLPTGRVGHLQIAGVPQRHEPDLGELNHEHLFDVIDEITAAGQWSGWIGCEYRPARGPVPAGTSDGLGWWRRRRSGRPASNRDRFLHFLDRYAAKDLAAIAALLAPQATLRDWNVSVRGAAAVLDETRRNFEAARTIEIEVLKLHDAGTTVAGELRILVDGSVELHAIDLIDFDAEGRVAAIRAYKGRGD